MSILDNIHDREGLAIALFPQGKRFRNGTIRVGNVEGEPGSSCVVDIKKGLWFDHATGKGGDLVDVIFTRLGTEEGKRFLKDWVREDYDHKVAEYVPPPKNDYEDFEIAPYEPAFHWADKVHTYRDANGNALIIMTRKGSGKQKRLRPWTWKSKARKDKKTGEWISL